MSEPSRYRVTSELVGQPKSLPKKVNKFAIWFQPDSVEVELRRLPFSARFALYTILILMLTALAWAWWVQIDRTVTARGKLVSESRMVVKQPYRSSVIRSLHARAGDFVESGTLLASLDPTLTKADEGQVRSKIELLTAELERLEAERLGEKFIPANPTEQVYRLQLDVFSQRKAEQETILERYAARGAALEAQYRIAVAQEEQISAQLQLAMQKLETAQSLAERNITTQAKLREAEAEVIRLQAAMREKSEEQDHLLRQKDIVSVERRQFLTTFDRELADRILALTNEIEQLEFNLRKALRMAELDTFVAETDGIIMDVTKKSVGSVVESAEVLFTMVPIEGDLEIELELSAKDIGWVHVGQPVRVKLDPFPFQRHGTLEGELRSISPDAFQRQVGAQTQVYYQARVRVVEDLLRNLPEDFKLLPGITTTAEIRIGKRTILSYITDPFHKALDESMKEPN